MDEMYSAMPGSPITYLVGDISVGQTTIAIADDTALPDAPNICTIGYGENIETIRYGAKSNGVLQEVTRGIEGTPRAWQSGTEVARFFTAYDHLTLIEKITENADNHAAHLAESASKHITESGSNENGYYIKFDDGTMICQHQTIHANLAMTTQVGSTGFYEKDANLIWEFPQPFVNSPNILPNTSLSGTNRYLVFDRDITTTTYSYRVASSGNITYDMRVHLTAIGRWK